MEAQEYILRLEKAKFDSKTKGVWYSQTPEGLNWANEECAIEEGSIHQDPSSLGSCLKLFGILDILSLLSISFSISTACKSTILDNF